MLPKSGSIVDINKENGVPLHLAIDNIKNSTSMVNLQ